MKKNITISFVIAISLAIGISVVMSQDDSLPDNGLDYPAGTTFNDTNWCFDGQQWGDGHCNSEEFSEWESTWHWECGWFLAHDDLGLLDIPEMCVPEMEAPDIQCGNKAMNLTDTDSYCHIPGESPRSYCSLSQVEYESLCEVVCNNFRIVDDGQFSYYLCDLK